MKQAFFRAYIVSAALIGNQFLTLRSSVAHVGGVRPVNATFLTDHRGILWAAGNGPCGQPEFDFFGVTPYRGSGRFPRGSPRAGRPWPPRPPAGCAGTPP